MAGNDYVELQPSNGPIGRFVERDDGWWLFGGDVEDWVFSEDEDHGFLVSFKPPGGTAKALGSFFVTARGRRLAVASIAKKEGQLRIILIRQE
jgi:hypothetical protein